MVSHLSPPTGRFTRSPVLVSAKADSLLSVLVIDPDVVQSARVVSLLVEGDQPIDVKAVSSCAEGLIAMAESRHDVYLIAARLGKAGIEALVETSQVAGAGPSLLLVDDYQFELEPDVGIADCLDSSQLTPLGLYRAIRSSIRTWSAAMEAARHRSADIEGATGEHHCNRLAEILEATPDFVGTADVNGRVQYANRAARRTAGIGDDFDVAGLELGDFHPQWAADLVANEAIPAALADGVWSGMTAFLGPDGSEVPTSQVIISHEASTGSAAYLSTVARDLSQELESNRRLGKSQALVGRAFHGAAIGMAITNADGYIVEANAAHEALLGYGPGELAGVHISEFTHPDDLAENNALIEQLVAGDTTEFRMEKRFVRPDGSVIRGLLHVSTLKGPEGAEGYRFAQVVDIDDRKRAEERVRFQGSLLDQVRNAVIATDLDGNVIYWNTFATAMFGWEVDEIIGTNLMEKIVPGHGGEVTARVMQALATDGSWTGEGVLHCKDGTTFSAWMSDSLLFDSNGLPTGVVGIKIDVSDLKRTEDLLRRQGEIAESVLRSVRFPVAVLDRRGKITAINREWTHFSIENGGNPATTGVGVNYLEVCRRATDESLALEALDGIEAVLRGHRDEFSLEYPCNGPGQERWFEMEVSPIPDGGAVVAHWNITEKVQIRAGLEETSKAKVTFIASLSHELRTPLTAILGLANELRDGSFSPEETTEFHNVIAQQSQELSLLVEDLLVAARLDSHTLALSPSDLPVIAEIDRVIAPWSAQGAVSFTVAGNPEVSVWADAGRFRQILRNLITNAIRHGAEPIGILVVGGPTGTNVSVTDHGPGVPDWALERMFEPDATFAGDEGWVASVGLGLHVSQGLADQMGGELSYARNDSVTKFTLTLPNREDHPTSEN